MHLESSLASRGMNKRSAAGSDTSYHVEFHDRHLEHTKVMRDRWALGKTRSLVSWGVKKQPLRGWGSQEAIGVAQSLWGQRKCEYVKANEML